jgi:pyridoxamine 5'-phosphate oxidase
MSDPAETRVNDPLARAAALVERGRRTHPKGEVPMVLATVDESGNPSARYVLLKEIDARGFVFYTNARSRKGRELAARPYAALVLFWPELGEQLRVEGAVEEVEAEVADAYWATRPLGSRLGALASAQSEPLESRAVLEARMDELAEALGSEEPVRPDHWTGYRVVPDVLEFWQHREDRMHHREMFLREAGEWEHTLLWP